MSFGVNVEARPETVTEFWPKWQSEVINGLYPLRRLLSGSDHSAVFLTDCKAQGIADAAIKMVPAERVTLALLSHWRMAVELSHPHLIRLLDTGLCQLEGRQFLFVVMEHAEQTLAQVLPNRALTAAEVQELLVPTLDALAFLHGKNLVQGQLKPANILVVNDQLKLATDTVRPGGEPRASLAERSAYDPPEATSSRLSPAGDIWSLGITLVEALTQHLPARSDDRSLVVGLPTSLPRALAETVQRCLSHDPTSRPTSAELYAQFKGAAQTPSAVSAPEAVAPKTPAVAIPAPELPKRRALGTPVLVAGLLVLFAASWAGWQLFQKSPSSRPSAARTLNSLAQQSVRTPAAAPHPPQTPESAPPEISAAPARTKPKESAPAPARSLPPPPDLPAQPVANPSSPALHEEIPSVPRSARATIHGHVKVAVLVIVDASGNVIDALMENPGPSPYFARLAKEASRKWQFPPADNQDSRQWLLRFEFGRGGTTARAAAKS